MDLQDLLAAADVWQADLDLQLDAARPRQRLVEQVRPVRHTCTHASAALPHCCVSSPGAARALQPMAAQRAGCRCWGLWHAHDGRSQEYAAPSLLPTDGAAGMPRSVAALGQWRMARDPCPRATEPRSGSRSRACGTTRMLPSSPLLTTRQTARRSTPPSAPRRHLQAHEHTPSPPRAARATPQARAGAPHGGLQGAAHR